MKKFNLRKKGPRDDDAYKTRLFKCYGNVVTYQADENSPVLGAFSLLRAQFQDCKNKRPAATVRGMLNRASGSGPSTVIRSRMYYANPGKKSPRLTRIMYGPIKTGEARAIEVQGMKGSDDKVDIEWLRQVERLVSSIHAQMEFQQSALHHNAAGSTKLLEQLVQDFGLTRDNPFYLFVANAAQDREKDFEKEEEWLAKPIEERYEAMESVASATYNQRSAMARRAHYCEDTTMKKHQTLKAPCRWQCGPGQGYLRTCRDCGQDHCMTCQWGDGYEGHNRYPMFCGACQNAKSRDPRGHKYKGQY